MIVTAIEKSTSGRKKIYIDGEYAFCLYKSEIPIWCVQDGEVTTEQIEDIYSTILLPRGKKRALFLLQNRDYSQKGLRDKLTKDGYPEELTDEIMKYVNSFHYVDDERFASNVIKNSQEFKSKKQIVQMLKLKGVSDDTIGISFDEHYQLEDSDDSPEIEAIKKIIKKKNISLSEMDYSEKQKLCASLYRKGFSMENICKVTGNSEFY